VEAARKYNRIVQHGTQSRSDRKWAEIAEHVKQGTYGKLLVSRGLCYKSRPSIEFKETTTPPTTLDFNLWLGPAADQPFHRNLVHYNWHWFWDFGNGDIGNQGVHQMDIARWVIPGATLPTSVVSLGGRFGYKDQGQTPNTQISVMDFGGTQLIFEVRHKTEPKYLGEGVGNTFHFEEGVISGHKFYPSGKNEGQPLAKIEAQRGPGGGDHFNNFIEAVRSRKQDHLNADILDGHYSSALCHLANVSYRMGQPVPFDKANKAFGDNKAAYETLARTAEYLKKDVGVMLDGEQVMLGKTLAVDASKETIVDDKAAAALLFREYRKPFIVPEAIA
jgi:predicted dehydrogenase